MSETFSHSWDVTAEKGRLGRGLVIVLVLMEVPCCCGLIARCALCIRPRRVSVLIVDVARMYRLIVGSIVAVNLIYIVLIVMVIVFVQSLKAICHRQWGSYQFRFPGLSTALWSVGVIIGIGCDWL